MAKIKFREKKYNEALNLLALVQNDDVFHKVAIKNLYAMIYYETNCIEELILLLDSYKSFLNSNVLIVQRLKDSHMNFISFLSKILKLKDFGDKSEIDYIRHEVENTPTFLSKEWVTVKINELL